MFYSLLKKYFIVVAILFVLVGSAFAFSIQPTSFTVTSDKWECKGTRAVGIGAECIKLEMKNSEQTAYLRQ